MTEKRRGLPHTSTQQVEVMCAFLEENPKAKACLMGETGGKNAPVVSGVAFTDKRHVYREMAKKVNRRCKLADTLKWTEEVARNRWDGIYTKYTKAVTMSKTTGEGVDATKDGHVSFEDKLEKACPCFARIDALFGSRQSVRPHSVVMTGAAANDGAQHEDDAADVIEDDAGAEAEKDDDDDDDESLEAASAARRRPAPKAAPPPAKKARKAKGDAESKTSPSLDSEAVRQLNDKFANKSSTQKSNTSFAAQYAKAEETRLAMLKDEMDFKKTMETERLKFEQKKYEEEKALERERAKSAVRLELIKAGLRGQELLDELKMQFPE